VVQRGNGQTEEVITRLQEIIRLCKEEGLSNEEMQEVVKVETEVLKYLQKTGSEHEHIANDRPSSQMQLGKPKEQSAQKRPKSVLSDDMLEVIAEIERKALSEIIHLQRERDELREERDRLLGQGHGSKVGPGEGERLREENRLLREENHALQVRLSTIGHGVPLGGSQLAREGLAHGQFDSQIAVYENELHRASAVISELRARLGNVAGLEGLHEQGERIRRETVELLSYKGRGQGEDYAVLRELQLRLEQEEQGKADFLEELKVFKQHYLELEEENRELKRARGSYEPVRSSTPEVVSARGGNRKRSGVADYESTLKDLKQALR
jgi:FtsZ-binding cell division protein ZapB